MSEKLGNKRAMSEVKSEPKKIDILDFVISSYDDFMHSKKPSADKTSVDIALGNSLPAAEKRCWSDELTNRFSISSENDFVFNENSVITGNLKQECNTYYLEEKIQKLQMINDNLKSVIEMQSSLNNNPMRRGTRDMSMLLPKMALYKTQMCDLWKANQFCSYGSKCWFAHGSHELRNLPSSVPRAIQPPLQNRLSQSVDRVSFPLPKAALYKTRMCNSWNANQFCSYGSKCWFAHGSHELRNLLPSVPPPIQPVVHSRVSQSIDRAPFPVPKVALHKTQMCNSWNTNQFCSYGNKCWFAHGSAELRRFSPSVPLSINTSLQSCPSQSIDQVSYSGR